MALSEAASVVAAESAPTPHADPQPVDSPEVDRQYDEPPAPPSETVAPAAGAPGSGVPDAGQPGGEQSPVPSPTQAFPPPPVQQPFRPEQFPPPQAPMGR
ncbi:hypothetical protein [Propionibacterium freudenreichii]|nr:hypothetical protein [Propionibacterium freudenreichii]MCT2974988.1 hypothetical protein [Propionibacterium freudenreichii]MDK9350207.1 hypothetical protein [Propionibacterium freudenreichii]